MPVQPADRKRCVSCKRWGGARNEGPWHGTLRSPRNACGQWVMWAELQAPGKDSGNGT